AGRFAPVFDETDTILVQADHVMVTVGQSIQWGDLLEGTKADLRRNNTIVADALTYQTGEADVFAGGDCCSGPGFAIDAIAAGKQGAISLHRFVQNGQSLVIGRDRRIYKELDKKGAVLEEYDRTPRQRPDNLDGVGHRSFADGRGVLTEEQIQKETARCLGCGATMVDEYMCVGCGQCTTQCKFDAIHLERVYDGAGVEFTEMKPVVIKQMVKRKGKIAFKKIKKKFGAV
ncbi:MAG: 4Fe-4S binding protein, partial [Eubacteriales bacterium]|nr:4Fe-4S binding protein [Eubacteriales bacterium]